MTKKLIPTACLILVILLRGPLCVPVRATTELVFNATPPVNHLQGTLAAQVLFAQSQILSPRPRDGDAQPHLVSMRKSLLLSREFKHVNGQWFQAVDLENNGIVYASDAWSCVLPAAWIMPGLTLEIRVSRFTAARGAGGSSLSINRSATNSVTKLAKLLAEYDRVTVAIADGNWKPEIVVPPASPANRGHVISIDHDASYGSVLFLNGQPVKVMRGFKKAYLSDGKRWREGAVPDQGIERKPQLFGVPVATLVGNYDPRGELQSYIHPALHGACGFCYSDDSSTLDDTDSHLRVETRDGVLKFRLANQRFADKCMNKFHVNVPEASLPRSVAVVSRGRVLDEKIVTPATEKLFAAPKAFLGGRLL